MSRVATDQASAHREAARRARRPASGSAGPRTGTSTAAKSSVPIVPIAASRAARVTTGSDQSTSGPACARPGTTRAGRLPPTTSARTSTATSAPAPARRGSRRAASAGSRRPGGRRRAAAAAWSRPAAQPAQADDQGRGQHHDGSHDDPGRRGGPGPVVAEASPTATGAAFPPATVKEKGRLGCPSAEVTRQSTVYSPPGRSAASGCVTVAPSTWTGPSETECRRPRSRRPRCRAAGPRR